MAISVLCLFTLIIAVSRVLTGDDGSKEKGEEMKACLEMFNEKNWKNDCCNAGLYKFFKNPEKCQKKEDDWTCEDSKCVINNEDIEEGGKLSNKKTIDLFERWAKEVPESKGMIDVIKKQCLDSGNDFYGEDDNTCPTTKLLVCIYFQYVMNCPEWKEDATCKKMSENAEKCKKVL